MAGPKEPQKQQQQPSMLQHFTYLCPGLHGPGTSQRIERRTFESFFLDASGSASTRMIIPLFQRRYCWNEKLVKGWWTDVLQGKRDHLGIHNSGNTVIKLSPFDQDTWILIDGQQRSTTTSLLVASIRDAVLSLDKDDKDKDKDKLVRRLEHVLYHDRKAWKTFKSSEGTIREGEDLAFCRLLPSFYDRKAYFELITEGLFLGRNQNGVTSEKQARLDDEVKAVDKPLDDPRAKCDEEFVSVQKQAKRYFDRQICYKLRKISGPEQRLRELENLADLALTKMGVTLVDVQNDINFAQVFLYLQTASLFSSGALLFNPTPGIHFTCVDLIRNQILACVMNKSVGEQERFYHAHWLGPIESRFAGRDADVLTRLVVRFVAKAAAAAASGGEHRRHVSKTERTVAGANAKGPKGSKPEGCLAYGKFVSLYEQRLRTVAMRPPKTNTGPAAEAEEDFDEDTMMETSIMLAKEMADFVALEAPEREQKTATSSVSNSQLVEEEEMPK